MLLHELQTNNLTEAFSLKAVTTAAAAAVLISFVGITMLPHQEAIDNNQYIIVRIEKSIRNNPSSGELDKFEELRKNASDAASDFAEGQRYGVADRTAKHLKYMDAQEKYKNYLNAMMKKYDIEGELK